jgi:hypothetical protein
MSKEGKMEKSFLNFKVSWFPMTLLIHFRLLTRLVPSFLFMFSDCLAYATLGGCSTALQLLYGIGFNVDSALAP